MKKFVAAAALAVALSAASAAPALAADVTDPGTGVSQLSACNSGGAGIGSTDLCKHGRGTHDTGSTSTCADKWGNDQGTNGGGTDFCKGRGTHGTEGHHAGVHSPICKWCNTSTPTPTTSETPAPTTKPVASHLPVTGASTGIIAGVAALMVAGGIFAVRVARRRGRHAGAAA